jgi:hypothetical protein
LERCAEFADNHHDIGASHRIIRSLPRFAKQFSLNQERQFVYVSPMDIDHTFRVVHFALAAAADHCTKNGDVQTLERILSRNVASHDQKNFNSRQFCGRIQRWRGHNGRRFRLVTSAPTTTELLALSPTVHQPVQDYATQCTAPLDVTVGGPQAGVNAKVLDDGNPLRRILQVNAERIRRGSVKDHFLQQRNFV